MLYVWGSKECARLFRAKLEFGEAIEEYVDLRAGVVEAFRQNRVVEWF